MELSRTTNVVVDCRLEEVDKAGEADAHESKESEDDRNRLMDPDVSDTAC